MSMIKNQNFGIEIELTGITRRNAARVIASYYGTSTYYIGTYYQTYGATDRKGRTWKAMSDGSIRTQVKRDGKIVDTNSGSYSCEVVSPILQYEDIEDLQNIVRALVKAGANHTPESLTRLLNLATGRQDLFYEALQIGSRANRWCHKISPELFRAMKEGGKASRDAAERVWYSTANDGYNGSISHEHYNSTRYHGINLHAYFSKGTVEFRLFNGTTHAGKIKAYIQFCLAMSGWAIESNDNRKFFKDCSGYTQEQKAALMTRVLVNRLGMSGPEFKTARLHLTATFHQTTQQAA